MGNDLVHPSLIAYKKGCRCDLCRKFKQERRRLYRQRKKEGLTTKRQPRTDFNTEIDFFDRLSHNQLNGCIEFTGCLDRKGYGEIRYYGRRWTTHRLSYYLHFGPIPQGLFVCHSCDNPKCCNPDHLFLGDNQANVTDMMIKERHWHQILTSQQVIEILSELKNYKWGMHTKLAKKYGISTCAISDIKKGKTWKHIKLG